MRNIILLSTLLIFACSSGDGSEDVPLPAYTVEGKWIWSPSERANAFLNMQVKIEQMQIQCMSLLMVLYLLIIV